MQNKCGISVEAKVAWCLNSGDIVNPSMGIRARLPVSHAPESRHHTPSALRVVHRTVVSKRCARRSVGAGAGSCCRDRTRHGCRVSRLQGRLAPSPGSNYPPQRPHLKVKLKAVMANLSKLRIKWDSSESG